MSEFSFIHSFPITSNLANPIESVLSFLPKSSIHPLFHLPHRNCHCISSRWFDCPVGIFHLFSSIYFNLLTLWLSEMKLILILHKIFCCCCFLLLHNIKSKLLKTLEKPGSSQLVPSCLHSLTAHTVTLIFHFHPHWTERSQCLDSSPPQLLFLVPSDIFSLPPFHWACSLSTVYGASSTKSFVSLEVRMDIVAPLHPLSILQPSMPWSLV